MNFFNLLKLAFFNLVSNKTRTGLTILGMVIGISSIILLYSLGSGLSAGVNEQLNQWGSNIIFVLPGKTFFDSSFSKLEDNDAEFISGIKGVDSSFALYMASMSVSKGNTSSSKMIIGFDPAFFDNFEQIGFLELNEGRKLKTTDSSSVIISQHIAENFYNKELKLREVLEIEGKKFTIVGISGTGTNMAASLFKNAIIMPESVLKELSPESKPSRIFVQFSEGIDIDELIYSIKTKLKKRHGVEDFQIITPEDMMEISNNVLWIIQAFLLSIAVIALIIGALGIANTVYMSVYERTNTLGIMKAIGATKKDILFLIILESGILGFLSGILGLVLGLILSFSSVELINSFLSLNLKFVFSFEVFFIAAFVSFSVGILAGYGAAKKAAELDAVEAIYS